MKKIFILLLLSSSILAQPWYYDFGTEVSSSFTTNNSASTTFLPAPPSGTARVRVSNGQGGGFYLDNPGLNEFGSGAELRIVAPTGGSVNKFSIYDYTAGKAYTIQFSIRFGAADGSATGATSGIWYFFAGDGAGFSDNSGFTGSQVFTGIRWQFGASGSITTNARVAGAWTSSGISGTPFAQGNTYTVDIYGNNTTTTANYNYFTTQSVAANTMDIWVNGVLVADDIGKALLANDSNIDSWMFYGESSADNVANIFLDDIYYTNTISDTVLPVELSSFSAIIMDNSVKLNWQTKTEVNNYGFEILRSTQNENAWSKLGFVHGHGNSNSPKNYTFTDDLNLTPNLSRTLSYRLKQIDTDGKIEYSKIINIDLGSPSQLELSQNYPNPFNPITTIKFSLPQSGNVKLTIYNLLGERVAELVNEFKESGVHTIYFDASELNSGVYIYKVESNGFVRARKMTLVK